MKATLREPLRVRWFGSIEFFWLWISQLISAFGDWVGLFAIWVFAAEHSDLPTSATTGLVLFARVVPSFVIGPFMGVIVDRYDRKLLMRISDLSRALIFCALPFTTQLWQLIVASLLIEAFALLFAPAKEALVPVLVPRERLTSANSLGILAAYGTMPFAGIAQTLLKAGNDRLSHIDWLEPLGFAQHGQSQTLAFYFDALTYVIAFVIVKTLIRTKAEPVHEAVASGAAEDSGPSGFRGVLAEVRAGWREIVGNPVVRAVNIGLGAGLLGGAMLVPLGPTFAELVVGDVNRFPLYITALGCGVAVGVGALTALQKKIPKERVFCGALFFAGGAILFGVSMSTFWLSAVGVFGLGLGAGAVYVLGYTLIQEHTIDDMRGRTFNTFLTLVRLAVLGALLLGPTLSTAIDPLMKRWIGGRTDLGTPAVRWFGVEYGLPGVRVTLWLAGLVILMAATLASHSVDPSAGRIHPFRRRREAEMS